jgi:iron complex transport system substrate-binding protein
MDARTIFQAPGTTKRRRGLLVALGGASLLAAATAISGQPGRAAESGFPVTLTDDEGSSVTIEAEPQRIVSLSPANTEIVFALGAGDRLVGGSAFDDFPAEAAALPDVATFDEGVVMETLVDLEPDLVLAGGNNLTPADDIARMRELGYPVLVLYPPDVPAVMADIELIGQAIGAAEEAETMTAEMSADLDAISDIATATGSAPRTYYELDYFEGTTYGPALDSFVADMVGLAGGTPVTTGDPIGFTMPLERLVEADPEVIVLGNARYGVCPADVAARPGWDGMSAVETGDIRPVEDIPVTRPGPRLAEGLAGLALANQPDQELPEVPPAPAYCEAA